MSEYEWLDIFGDNLKSMLKESKTNQKELSEKTGLSESTISNYINKLKIPTATSILNIACALDCDVSELIDFGERIEL